MSIWKYIASDYDRHARGEIEDLKQELAGAVDTQMFAHWQERVRRLEQRQERLALASAALARLLEMKGLITDEEMETMVLQLDLLDGREDGKIGETPAAAAPRCKKCNHYVNPTRGACVYCGHALAMNSDGSPYRGGVAVEMAEAPGPQIACTLCGNTVPQEYSYFSGDGVVCANCFQG